MNDHLTRDAWQRMSAQDRELEARRIAKALPAGFHFRSLTDYRQDSMEHYAAE